MIRKQTTNLLTSAVEFLVEAFSNIETHKPRFAIVHAVTSAELILKERLARIHPNLIFQNIDALIALSSKRCLSVTFPCACST